MKGDAEIAGLYSENNGINLVRLTDAVREGTVPHEVGHFIFNAIFSAKERRKLLEYYKSKIKDVVGLTEKELNRRAEEMFCDDFAEYFLNDESKPKTKLQRMKEKMKRFLHKLVDMFSFKNHPYTEEELDLRRDDVDITNESLAALFGRMANGDIYNRRLNENNTENTAKQNNIYAAIASNDLYTPEAKMQMDAVRKKYEGTDKWMKAPNGKPTNLTEEQWLLVRTPNFKNWFGNWEKHYRIEKLKASEPVTVDFKNEFEVNANDAERYLKDNVTGNYFNEDTNETIIVSNNAIRKLLSHDRYNEIHLKSVVAIPEMLKRAIFITEELNDKGSKHFNKYQYFVCGVKFNGEDCTVKLVVGIRDGKRYYDHSLSKIEKGTLIDGLLGNIPSGTSQHSLSDAKDSRLLEILQDNSSKVLDENGEPLVVYHGTRNQFDVFNTDGVKWRKTEGTGSFFTDNAQVAEGYAKYGGNVYHCFLNIRTPYVVDFGGNSWDNVPGRPAGYFVNHKGPEEWTEWFDNKMDAEYAAQEGDDVVEDYGEEGERFTLDDLIREARGANEYDGVVARNISDNATGLLYADNTKANDYVIFNPNQVKSATDNNGNFDPSNENIHAQFVSARQASNFEVTRDMVTRAKEMYDSGATDQDVWKETGCIRYADGTIKLHVPFTDSDIVSNGLPSGFNVKTDAEIINKKIKNPFGIGEKKIDVQAAVTVNLSDMLDPDNVFFKMMPFLKDVKVRYIVPTAKTIEKIGKGPAGILMYVKWPLPQYQTILTSIRI